MRQRRRQAEDGDDLRSAARFASGFNPAARSGLVGVPLQSAIQQMAAYTDLLRQSQRQMEAYAAIRARWRRAMIKAVGVDAWQAWRDFSRRQREADRARGKSGMTRADWAARSIARGKARRESLRLLGKAGINRDRLVAINKPFHDELRALDAASALRNTIRWTHTDVTLPPPPPHHRPRR